MKKIKLSIVAVVTIMCSLLTTDTLQATHIVGGNLYYQCLGDNDYRVTFEMRRDCFNGADDAQFDDPASIAIYDGEGNLMSRLGRFGLLQIPFSSSDTLNEILTSECRVFGQDVCVHTTTYQADINLPPSETGYVLVYQRCCRNNTLNNIIEPLVQGATYSVTISPEAMDLCNSTPQFNAWPDIYLCNNDFYRFDHSAFDRDGDSLVYELCVPSVGGTFEDPKPIPALAPPFDEVVWAPPFSLRNMMGGTAPLRIDRETGELSVRPDIIGQFLIGICVKEYRDGELLSVVKRDFEFNTRICNDAPEANFVVEPNPQCDGLDVTFENNSTPNREYLWFFDYNGDRSLTSTEQSPTFTFPESGRYRVRLEVTDGECLDIFNQTIGVSAAGEIQPDFEISSDDCADNFSFRFEDKTTSNQLIIDREWQIDYGGSVFTEDSEDFVLSLPKEDRTAVITYTVTGETGCKETIVRTIDLHYFDPKPISADIEICFGESTDLLDSEDGDFTYTWSPSTGLDLSNPRSPIAAPMESIVYELQLSDGICNTQISIPVSVSDEIEYSLNIDDDNQIDFCFFENFQLEAQTDNPNLRFIWSDEAGRVIHRGPNLRLEERDNGIVNLEVRNQDGCVVNESFNVTVPPSFEIDLGLDIDDDGLNLCFGEELDVSATSSSGVTLEWFLNDERIQEGGELLLTPISSGLYTIVGTDAAGCEITEQLDITVYDEIEYSLNVDDNNIDFCFFETFTLSAATDNPELRFVWSDENGRVIHRGDNLRLEEDDRGVVNLEVRDQFGCTVTEQFNVDVPPSFELDLGLDVDNNELALCFGDELDVTAATSAGVDVEWFLDGERIQRGERLTLTPLQSGVYTVVGTDGAGCEISEELDVTVYDEIEYNLNVEDNNIDFCFFETFTLSATTDDPDLRFVWTNGEGTVIHRGDNLRLEPSDDGVVNLEVRNPFGCTETESFNITVPPAFELDLGLGLDDNKVSLCFGDELDVTASTSAGIDVEWILNGETIEDGNQLVVTPTESGIYTVIGRDAAGCEVQEELEVEVFDEIIFETNATDGSVSYCFDESFTLMVTGSENLTYNWVNIDGISLGTDTELLLDDDMDQIITLIVSDENGCTVEETINVNVYENFEITFDSEEIIYCPSEPADISIMASTDVTVLWFDADGNPVGSGSDFSFEATMATTLTAVIFSTDGCRKEQVFNLSPLTIEYINPESVEICAGESTTIEFLDNGITTPLTFDWDNGDAVSNFEPIGNLTVNPTSTTLFTVTATSDNGCQFVDSTLVIVNDFAENLTATADPIRIAVGQSSQLEVDDITGYEYSWSPPGTLDNPNIPNPIATPTDGNGTYTVTVTDPNGCTSTASVTLMIETAVCDENDVWLPNMFTPNGDGMNDVFKAESNFVDDFEMIIYNRWGEEVFVSGNIETGWNGTFMGEELEPDVYGYCIRATCTNGVEYVATGNVTIVK